MASLYRTSPRTFATALAGLGLVLLPALFADRLIRTDRRLRSRGVNRFDRPAIGQASLLAEWLGNVGMTVGIATPFVVDWIDVGGRREIFAADAVVFGEALAINGALNTAVKYIVQRPLPETYAGVVGNRRGKPRGYRAFYAGHVSSVATALTAACLTLHMRRGPSRWHWRWIASAVVTVLVGVARFYSGKHFPSDVLVGTLAGVAIGAIVPWLHATPRAASCSTQYGPTTLADPDR